MSTQMIWAVIRPERKPEVLKRLEAEGFFAMTEIPVSGRGQDRGVQVGPVIYDELAKTLLVLAVGEQDCPRAVEAILGMGRFLSSRYGRFTP